MYYSNIKADKLGYLQHASHTVNEEPPTVLSRVFHSHAFDLIPDSADDFLNLIIGEEVGNLSGGEQVVDEHQEALLGHLGISHQEHGSDVLHSRLLVQCTKVQFQIRNGVAFP